MKIKEIFLLVGIIAIFNFSFSQNIEKKKIGVIFNINGPYKITRQVLINAVGNSNNLNKNDAFYGAIMFLGTEKANPTERLVNAYLENLNTLGETTQITETIDGENYSNFNTQNKESLSDISKNLKTKYNLDYLLIVNGQFGLEFESVGAISGDKRTSISLNNTFINVNTNEIISNFNIGNIKNISKKNLLSPPNFPNIVESMDRLLNERILPEIENKNKIKRKIIIL